VQPNKDAILACGSNKNSAKLLSMETGDVIYDLKDSHHLLGSSPVILVDSAPNGKTCLVGTANGSLFVKNVLISKERCDDGSGSDSDFSP